MKLRSYCAGRVDVPRDHLGALPALLGVGSCRRTERVCADPRAPPAAARSVPGLSAAWTWTWEASPRVVGAGQPPAPQMLTVRSGTGPLVQNRTVCRTTWRRRMGFTQVSAGGAGPAGGRPRAPLPLLSDSW